MIVWIGLVIGFLSSVAAIFADLKYPKGVRPWSGVFIRRNRFRVAAVCLTAFGFITATLTVLDDRSKADEAQRDLRFQYDQLKALMLAGKVVSPTVEILIQQSGPLDLRKRVAEHIAWENGPHEFPTIGFVPSAARRDLFGVPGRLSNRDGDIDLRLDAEIRFSFMVEKDGSATNGVFALHGSKLRTSMVEDEGAPGKLAIRFQLTVDSKVEALKIFDRFVQAYDQPDDSPPLYVVAYGDACDNTDHSRAARVSISLGDHMAVVALLQEAAPKCKPNGTTYHQWLFKKPPELVVTR